MSNHVENNSHCSHLREYALKLDLLLQVGLKLHLGRIFRKEIYLKFVLQPDQATGLFVEIAIEIIPGFDASLPIDRFGKFPRFSPSNQFSSRASGLKT